MCITVPIRRVRLFGSVCPSTLSWSCPCSRPSTRFFREQTCIRLIYQRLIYQRIYGSQTIYQYPMRASWRLHDTDEIQLEYIHLQLCLEVGSRSWENFPSPRFHLWWVVWGDRHSNTCRFAEKNSCISLHHMNNNSCIFHIFWSLWERFDQSDCCT